MQKKKVFLSAMEKDEQEARRLFAAISSLGMDVSGHFWEHDQDDLTRVLPSAEVEKCDVWVVYAPKPLTERSVIALSMTVLTARTYREHQLPVIIVGQKQELPEILGNAEFCEAGRLTLRIPARAAIRKKWNADDFRICARCQAGVGYWLEVGPADAQTKWNGVLVGVDSSLGGVIDFQAVGPKGALPDKTVLNYPVKDAKLSAGEQEYTAWGCQNQLNFESSFYVRVKGFVPSILLGEGLAEQESMECRIIRLR